LRDSIAAASEQLRRSSGNIPRRGYSWFARAKLRQQPEARHERPEVRPAPLADEVVGAPRIEQAQVPRMKLPGERFSPIQGSYARRGAVFTLGSYHCWQRHLQRAAMRWRYWTLATWNQTKGPLVALKKEQI